MTIDDYSNKSQKTAMRGRTMPKDMMPDPEDDYSDTMSNRLRRKLDRVPVGEDMREKMKEQLNDSVSIEGDIKEVALEDGPVVRKYLEKYAEHVKRNEFRQYSQS